MPVKKSKNSPDTEKVVLNAVTFVKNKEQIKVLETENKKARPLLESYLSSSGKTLAGGNVVAVVPFGDKDVILKNTLRTSKVLRPEAIDVIKEHPELISCIETVEIIREDILEGLVQAEGVSTDTLEKIYALKQNYAFTAAITDRSHGEEG